MLECVLTMSCLKKFAESKIGDFWRKVGQRFRLGIVMPTQHNVGGFEISVRDAFLMNRMPPHQQSSESTEPTSMPRGCHQIMATASRQPDPILTPFCHRPRDWTIGVSLPKFENVGMIQFVGDRIRRPLIS